jgi:hypothetical protein
VPVAIHVMSSLEHQPKTFSDQPITTVNSLPSYCQLCKFRTLLFGCQPIVCTRRIAGIAKNWPPNGANDRLQTTYAEQCGWFLGANYSIPFLAPPTSTLQISYFLLENAANRFECFVARRTMGKSIKRPPSGANNKVRLQTVHFVAQTPCVGECGWFLGPIADPDSLES